MIRVENITIEEFRGIRNLSLDFNGKNFAICGPNGTGKSGIVDALEFALTGNVSRLSGHGTGDISLKEHAPHVDSRNSPEKARVIIKVSIPSLQKIATITRSPRTPNTSDISPNDPKVLTILKQIQMHPEFVLSRRELIRYVIASPGKRAEEVQALLRLEQVGQVRQSFQKIANSCKREADSLIRPRDQARENLLTALGISQLTKQGVLDATNEKRKILGLTELPDLAETTSLKDGLAATTVSHATRIPKVQALTDIQKTHQVLGEITSIETVNKVDEIKTDLSTLGADPLFAIGVKQESFFTTGLDLVVNERCPFCDTKWDSNLLKKHVQDKIGLLKEVANKRNLVVEKISPIIVLLRTVQTQIQTLLRYGKLGKPPINAEAAQEYCNAINGICARLEVVVPLSDALAALAEVATLPLAVTEDIRKIESMLSGLPEPTLQDAARDFLTVGQERLDIYRTAARNHRVAEDKASHVKKISDIYGATSDKVLEGIYKSVQTVFSNFYGFINREDEGNFTARLTPSLGKLGFDVDFYGRGFFPPGAYHSEGHQDGMGLCLYLALMRYLQGPCFTLAVLDDVLMSVDAGHRREVCALLKKEFPDTQFIVTTHDPVWLMHMRTEGIITSRSAVQFKNWSVDDGPSWWNEGDVWAEIDQHLKQNDVPTGAALLRRYLEFVARELCHRLRVPVEFRGDAQYQLGELLPPTINHIKELLRKAKDAANSWNQQDVVKEIKEREMKFVQLVQTSNIEQWQVNSAVHYNAWANFTKTDFSPVVLAFRELLDDLRCKECGEFFRVSPERESFESLRCQCGKTNLNLKKKS